MRLQEERGTIRDILGQGKKTPCFYTLVFYEEWWLISTKNTLEFLELKTIKCFEKPYDFWGGQEICFCRLKTTKCSKIFLFKGAKLEMKWPMSNTHTHTNHRTTLAFLSGHPAILNSPNYLRFFCPLHWHGKSINWRGLQDSGFRKM